MAGKSPVRATAEQVRMLYQGGGADRAEADRAQKHPLDAQGLDQGGPFAGRKGRIEGEAPATPEARTALATLYSALMTAHLLRRLDAPGDLIVEGGFTRSPAFAAVLAGLMPDRRVVVAPKSAGAAAGAALLAHWGEPHEPPHLEAARAWVIPGLKDYRERWERGL